MKKLAILALVLLFSLALLGLGYAKWSKTLTINGTVNTGEVDWGFSMFQILDEDAPPPYYPTTTPDYTCNDGFAGGNYWKSDKNVGWGVGQLVDTDGDGDNDALDLYLHNAYPSYFNAIYAYPQNTGTIPIKIDSVVIEGNVIRKPSVVQLDLTGDGKYDIEILWGNNFGAQLDPGDPPVEISFWVHVLQDAPQGQTLHFTIGIEAIQWNEYTP